MSPEFEWKLNSSVDKNDGYIPVPPNSEGLKIFDYLADSTMPTEKRC